MSTASVSTPPYSRPPIIEAVIGITFAQPIKEAVMATADRRFSKYYPAHLDINNFSVNVNLNAVVGASKTIAPSAEHEVTHGHRRMSPGMDEVAVLMPNSLTISQLAPYMGWDAFAARFQRDLALYKRPGTVREISRVGVRYINRIDIPIGGNVIEYEQYLNLYPQVPDTLGPIVGYGMQTIFSLENVGCLATINTAPVPSPTLGHASFVLDIDVYKAADLPMNDADLYALLGHMRVEKNRLFEACITQRARQEIFEHANT